MSRFTPGTQLRGSAIRSGFTAISERALAHIGAIEQRIAQYREEAVLRSLDRRLLEDIGFESAPKHEGRPDHAYRNEFTPLWEVFSWTRFAK